MQLKSCFGFDTFFAVDVRRFGDGGIFIGNLRKPIEEVLPKLEKKLSEAAGREVELWFMEERNNDITKQVSCCNFVGLFNCYNFFFLPLLKATFLLCKWRRKIMGLVFDVIWFNVGIVPP